jgi:hypothetical protein
MSDIPYNTIDTRFIWIIIHYLWLIISHYNLTSLLLLHIINFNIKTIKVRINKVRINNPPSIIKKYSGGINILLTISVELQLSPTIASFT